jgi:hypothetical protein
MTDQVQEDVIRTQAEGLAPASRGTLAFMERLPRRLLDVLAWFFLLLGLLVLFLVLVIGPAGARSQEGIAQRRIANSVVFVASDFDTYLNLSGTSLPVCGATNLGGSAVALVIDNSSSMGSGPGSPLEIAKAAAQDFVRNLSVGQGEDAVTVVRFDDSGQTLYPIGFDANAATAAIGGINTGGGTAIDQGLREARSALKSAPAGTAPIIVLLTDGESDPNAAIQEANQAKLEGVQIISIALGSGAGQGLLRAIASSDQDYYESPDPSALANVYQQISTQIGQVVATNVRVQESYDQDHFALADGSGTNPGQFDIKYRTMTSSGKEAAYRLHADDIGWWSVSPLPGTLSYDNCSAQLTTQTLPAGPQILVLPPLWLFLLPLLLALLWLLLRLFYWWWKNRQIPALADRGPRTFPPSPVPAPLGWSGASTSWEPEPALIIGLGGTGRWVLTHLKRNLLDAGGGAWRSHVQLLSLDTAAQEFIGGTQKSVEFAGTSLSPQEMLVLTEENLDALITAVCQAQAGEHQELSQWFPGCDYDNRLGMGQRDLARGTGGRRPMGRIAIFRNLKDGLATSTLWSRLTGVIKQITDASARQGFQYARRMHVLIVGSLAGGFGSGSVIDVAYLSRRASQACGLQFADTEVSLFLVGNAPFDAQATMLGATPLTQINTRAALREIERFLLSRSQSFSMHYTSSSADTSSGAGQSGHQGGREPMEQQVLQGAAKNIIDDCWFFDGERSNYSLATQDMPPDVALFPMLADAMMVLLDTNAQAQGAQLGALRRKATAEAQDLAVDLGQGVFSSLGSFTYRLPMRDLVTFLKVKFARQLLAMLLTGDPTADLTTPLKSDANREAGGSTPLNHAGNFMAGKVGSGPAPFALQVTRAIQTNSAMVEYEEALTDIALRSRSEGPDTYLTLETKDFSLYLRNAVARLLNGSSNMLTVARTGKLAYAQAFLTELVGLLRQAGHNQDWLRQKNLSRWAPEAARILPDVLDRYIQVATRLSEQLKQQEDALMKAVYFGDVGLQHGATCVVDQLSWYEEGADKALDSLYIVHSVRRYLLTGDDEAKQLRTELLNNWYDAYFSPHLNQALEYMRWELPNEQEGVILTARVGEEPGVGLHRAGIDQFSQALLSIADHAGRDIWQKNQAVRLLTDSLEKVANDSSQIADIHRRSEPVLPYVAAGVGRHVRDTRLLWGPTEVTDQRWVEVRERIRTGLTGQGISPLTSLESTDLYSCTALYLRDFVPTGAIPRISQLEESYLRYYGMIAAQGINTVAQGAINPEPSAVFPAERRANEIYEHFMQEMPDRVAWLLSPLFVGALDYLPRTQLFLLSYGAGLVALRATGTGADTICVLRLQGQELQLTVAGTGYKQVAQEIFGMQNFVLDSVDPRLTQQPGWADRESRLRQTLDSMEPAQLIDRWKQFNQQYINKTRDRGPFRLDDLIMSARIQIMLEGRRLMSAADNR